MLKKIHRHIQKHLGKKEDKNVLLLCLLLITMVVAIAYMVVMPSKKDSSQNNEKVLLNTKEISVGTPFRVATTHLCAAVLEGNITSSTDDSIELTLLKEQDGTRAFVPIEPPEVHTIKNGTCIPAHSACEGMNFEYCFTINTSQKPVIVNYEVREK